MSFVNLCGTFRFESFLNIYYRPLYPWAHGYDENYNISLHWQSREYMDIIGIGEVTINLIDSQWLILIRVLKLDL